MHAPAGACREVIHRDPSSGGEVFHVTLDLDRGVSWEQALAFR